MTPLLQFRLWWRRGNAGERMAATIATTIVVALAVWVLVPTTSGVSSTSTSPNGATNGAAAAGESPDATTPDSVAPGAGDAGTTGATTGGGTATGGNTAAPAGGGATAAQTTNSCLPTPSGAVGITDKTIQLGVPVLDLAGPIGNGAAGQAAADDLIKITQAVIDDINARGGVQCRQ